MTRIFILTGLVVLSLSLSVLASTGSSNVSIGLKGGLGLGRAHSEGMINQFGVSKSFRTALSGGMSLGVKIGKNVVWQPELLIVQNGAVYSDPSGDAKLTFKLTMLEIPMLLNWQMERPEKVSPNFFGGMFLALPLSAHYQTKGFFIPDDGEVDIMNYINGTEIGVVIGTGMTVAFSKTELTFEARCDYGLSGMLKRTMFGVSKDASTYTFLILGGLRFYL